MENEERIGFFKRIGIAMTKPKDYYKIAKQSAGKSIGIYFILSILYTAVITALLIFVYLGFMQFAKDYINNIPEFSISKNGFISQMDKPIEFYDEINNVLLYINSNNTLDEIKEINVDKIFGANMYVLIGKDAISFKDQEANITTMTYPELFEKDEMNNENNEYIQIDNTNEINNTISGEENEELIQEQFNENEDVITPNVENVQENSEEEFAINNQTLLEIYSIVETSNYKYIILAIFAIIMILIMFIIFIVSGLIYSILALIVASINKKKLSFKELFNIAMYSKITTTIISIFMLFISFKYWNIIKLVIIVFYMQVALSNYDDNSKIDVKIEDDNSSEK